MLHKSIFILLAIIVLGKNKFEVVKFNFSGKRGILLPSDSTAGLEQRTAVQDSHWYT